MSIIATFLIRFRFFSEKTPLDHLDIVSKYQFFFPGGKNNKTIINNKKLTLGFHLVTFHNQNTVRHLQQRFSFFFHSPWRTNRLNHLWSRFIITNYHHIQLLVTNAAKTTRHRLRIEEFCWFVLLVVSSFLVVVSSGTLTPVFIN